MSHEEAKLTEFKKRLLDLSMRNNLLNYRDKKTGTLHIVIPDMVTTYKRIVINEKPMTFKESSPEGDSRVRSTKEAGQTIETERTTRGDLIRSLRRLDSVARSSIEEQGINILHLAFGMLNWVDDSQKEHLAPLVLAPVRLFRASARSSFVLQAGDDDPVVNPTLSYFLEQEHGITLPDFENEDQLQQFVISVGELVQKKRGWSVSNDVVLSTFQFQKLSMYHDLEARSDEILAHPIVKAIMGDRSALELNEETKNPDSLSPMDTFQVVDADSSQQAAIIAAHRGESFVLQGPPGTGKSQTITNIIADCLGNGKKVLFVSEKKAALDVVHRRLTQAKLDDFCLVLHSNKAGKKEVLNQLSRTLNLYGTLPRMSPAAKTKLDIIVRLRNELNLYAQDIYTRDEYMGRSPHEVIGIVARFEKDGIPYVPFRFDGLDKVTPEKITEMSEAARLYSYELKSLGGAPGDNPWVSFGITGLEYGESDEVARTFEKTAEGARKLLDLWRRMANELNLDVSPTIDSMEACQGLLEDLASMPIVSLGISSTDEATAKRKVDDWRKAEARLIESRYKTQKQLEKLAQLDPDLDLRVDERKLNLVGYTVSLSEELERRLRSIPHYSAWRKMSYEDLNIVLSQLASLKSTYQGFKDAILVDYHPEILDMDFIAMEGRFKTEYQSFFKRVFGQHGEDIRTLSGLRRTAGQIDDDEAKRILALLHSTSDTVRALDDRSVTFNAILGELYMGLQTDFSQIARKREALSEAIACLNALSAHSMMVANFENLASNYSRTFEGLFDRNDPRWTNRALASIDSFEALQKRCIENKQETNLERVAPVLANGSAASVASPISDELRTILGKYKRAFKKASELASGAKIRLRSLDLLATSIDRATSSGKAALERSAAYNGAKEACENLGMGDFIKAISRYKWSLNNDSLDQYDLIFQHSFYRLWLGGFIWKEREALRKFSSAEHERKINLFASLDTEQLGINQARVLTKLFPSIPSPKNVRARGKDEISILLRELNKKTRIRPIRRLFADIPHAVLALKPCLMMSPLSVSTYLESATFQFDTVIFDEASQVRTEDALGVISRGKQVIIAGDSKQLPPTNFFAATVSEDDDEGDEEYYEQAGSFDSVLDEAALLNPISLKWHYRSRDESLITFSNMEIYDGGLFTFPSSHANGQDSGVEYVYVQNGIYEGSRKGNVIEATRVTDLVFEHFRVWGTSRSLGVIALGENQARVIENELLSRRMAQPDSEKYFDAGITEPFFVKNLENVQGDERDTIILSVGYAKGPNGRLSHNFGPINMAGGERRLNVAITRARTNLKLVTSLDPSEIDPSRVSNIGPLMLKNYLSYAKIGSYSDDVNLLREYGYVDEDEFVNVILELLEDKGYKVENNVGNSGCKIDLAVRHPIHSDCFCIGIVCDGDSYHAAQTARDRDRLRSQVLKQMGWKLYHIWSCEWLTDPEGQKEQLFAAVKTAVETFVPPVERTEAETSPSPSVTAEVHVEEPSREAQSSSTVNQVIEDLASPSQSVLESEYVVVERNIEEHRYGFQNFPKYHPPRHGAISDEEVMKQLVFAQAPFSLDYFLQKYRELCHPSSQRINSTIRNSAMGLIAIRLSDLVVIRREHDVRYVFRKDQKKIVPRIAGDRNIADISTSEIREGVMAVLRGYMGELDRKGLIEETSSAFEFARRGRVIDERIGEAIDDLRLFGKVKIVAGFYVPVGR